HLFIRRLGSDRTPAGETDPPTGKAQAARVYQAGLKTLSRARVQLALDADKHDCWHDLLERALHQQVLKERAHMESGLGWLASIGSTAPFVGLFGTVWGIMHALKDISQKGSASLEVVAGPIGEALVAIALGIAVAIPAVIAYNFFLRQSRKLTAALDHFAADFLHSTIEDHLTGQTVREHGHASAE
ncbi:MAG: MotA/TolQ/ExbB proton channel family protein, partial [Proteobacteria bacterium]|nr:MotA/TolQ/ExbB proton channel family protein [Pseudomonadota bacterium]